MGLVTNMVMVTMVNIIMELITQLTMQLHTQLIPPNRSMQLLQSQLLVNKFIMFNMLSIQNLFNMLNMLNPMVSPKGRLQGQFPSELFANLLQSDLDHLNNQCADLKPQYVSFFTSALKCCQTEM